MIDRQKVERLIDLLEQNNGSVAVSDLVASTGSERRARRAVFMARKVGFKLEAKRDGRGVSSYTLAAPVDFAAALVLLEPKRKPKAPVVKKQKVAKTSKPKTKAKKAVVDELAAIMTSDADEAPLGEA